jgi:branched-chain amino acid transport system permease protein
MLQLIGQQLINGLALGSLYALIALGYTLVYGIIELINFAHGDVFMWGSFIALSILTAFGINADHQIAGGLLSAVGVLVLTVALAMVCCAAINMIVERVAYKPLRKAPRLAPLISAIGASFILEDSAKLWQGNSPLFFPTIIPDVNFTIAGVTITSIDILALVVSIILMFALDRFISRTRLGKAMRATAQDPEAAALMGINIDLTILLTFLLGGALAGAAGVIYSMKIGQAWYVNGFTVGLKAFTAAVLGGIGNIIGAALGGLLIGILEAYATQLFGDKWTDVVVFAILVLVLVFRPSGLLGQQVPEKV